MKQYVKVFVTPATKVVKKLQKSKVQFKEKS